MSLLLNIRSASAKDLPKIWQLASDYGVYLPEPENHIWLAESYLQENRPLLGFIACCIAVDEMTVLGLAVNSTSQRKGIATALHQTAITQLQPARSFLEVRESNKGAQALYQKLGYISIDQRKHYYRTPDGGYEDAIVMRWH